MKTNIKMKVTLEQSIKVQEICFANGIIWTHKVKQLTNLHLPYLYICDIKGIYATLDIECFNGHKEYEEMDADLFIRTNGTCEEDIFTLTDSAYSNSDAVIKRDKFLMTHKEIDFKQTKYAINNLTIALLEQKLKKKNDILKKARIKRKNQREELHKLNLKLQKSISLEEHKEIVDKVNKGNVNYLSNNIISRDKEIEKLKAVIEYLESKVK